MFLSQVNRSTNQNSGYIIENNINQNVYGSEQEMKIAQWKACPFTGSVILVAKYVKLLSQDKAKKEKGLFRVPWSKKIGSAGRQTLF